MLSTSRSTSASRLVPGVGAVTDGMLVVAVVIVSSVVWWWVVWSVG